MKVLIAITCCAVLAAITFYFVQSYRSSVAEAAAAAQAETVASRAAAIALKYECEELMNETERSVRIMLKRGELRPRCWDIGLDVGY